MPIVAKLLSNVEVAEVLQAGQDGEHGGLNVAWDDLGKEDVDRKKADRLVDLISYGSCDVGIHCRIEPKAVPSTQHEGKEVPECRKHAADPEHDRRFFVGEPQIVSEDADEKEDLGGYV